VRETTTGGRGKGKEQKPGYSLCYGAWQSLTFPWRWDVLQAQETTQQNKPSREIAMDLGKIRLDNHRSVISPIFFIIYLMSGIRISNISKWISGKNTLLGATIIWTSMGSIIHFPPRFLSHNINQYKEKKLEQRRRIMISVSQHEH